MNPPFVISFLILCLNRVQFLNSVSPNALFTLFNGWQDTMAYIKVADEHPAIAERASTFVAAANQVSRLLSPLMHQVPSHVLHDPHLQLGAFAGSLVSFLLVMLYLE